MKKIDKDIRVGVLFVSPKKKTKSDNTHRDDRKLNKRNGGGIFYSYFKTRTIIVDPID